MTDFRSPLPAAPLARPATSLDEARERAIRLLTDGFAYDVITVEEFEWRLGQMSQLDTPRAIDALVADLATPVSPVAVGSRELAAVEPEGRILGIMSETRRQGPWRVPQRLKVKGVMSDVKIDLRYAIIPPECLIDVTAIMANVSFIVSPGMIVDFDVTAFMGAAGNDSRATGTGAYQRPRVRIRGSAIMAEVRVKVRELGR
jgi:hypothetical protein